MKIVLDNRRFTVRDVAEDIGKSFSLFNAIFSNFFLLEKFILNLLNFDQKKLRMRVAQELLNDINEDPDLLKRVITGNQTWVYDYDVEAKTQTSQRKWSEEIKLKKAQRLH